MSSKSTIPISEIFRSIQGEGPSSGQSAIFVRAGGCNLHCWWCDTPYTWRFSETFDHVDGTIFDPKAELTSMSEDEIVEAVLALSSPQPPRLVVFTGGEPLLHRSRLWSVIYSLSQVPRLSETTFEIETAGTLPPIDFGSQVALRYNVSPKLSNSGNPKELRYHPEVLRQLSLIEGTAFKFVVTSAFKQEFEEIQEIVREVGITARQIWVMPEGTSSDSLSQTGKQIIDEVVSRGWNYSDRLHVRLWGARRGV